ncbi:hypothetical protein, partial [Streptomyces sp. NPDC003487]
PEDVWREHTCLIVHPGPPGDRGPSSLDRAVSARLVRLDGRVVPLGGWPRDRAATPFGGSS